MYIVIQFCVVILEVLVSWNRLIFRLVKNVDMFRIKEFLKTILKYTKDDTQQY